MFFFPTPRKSSCLQIRSVALTVFIPTELIWFAIPFLLRGEEIGLMIWFCNVTCPNYAEFFIVLLTYVTLQLIPKLIKISLAVFKKNIKVKLRNRIIISIFVIFMLKVNFQNCTSDLFYILKPFTPMWENHQAKHLYMACHNKELTAQHTCFLYLKQHFHVCQTFFKIIEILRVFYCSVSFHYLACFIMRFNFSVDVSKIKHS